MSYREIEQLMNNYSIEQAKKISLFDAYHEYLDKKKDKVAAKSSK